MEEKDILLLESLGYRFSEQGAIIDKDGNFVPQVSYNGRVIESPASQEEYQAELDYKSFLDNIQFSHNENNPEPKRVQSDIAVAKNQIQQFEKNPLYASIPKESKGTVYEKAFEEYRNEKLENGEFVHNSLDEMYEEFEPSVYKDIEDEEARNRLKQVDKRLSEIKAKDPDVDAVAEFNSDESKGFIISSLGGIPTVVATPTKNSNFLEKAGFWLYDFAGDISTGIISTLSPTGTGMEDEELQKEYKDLTDERRVLMKPIAAKRMAEVDTLIEELKAKKEETDFWSTENDKYAYAITTLENQKQDLDNFLDDNKWYELHEHAMDILNINNIADWASLGLYEAYASWKYKAGLRDKIDEGKELDEVDVALAKAFAKEEEILSNGFEQNFVTDVVSGTNESLKFLGFGFSGRTAGRSIARSIAKKSGARFLQETASTAAQVFLHPQTYSNAFNYYGGEFQVYTNENGETEVLAGERLYQSQKKENQLALEQLDNEIAQELNDEKKLALQKQRVELKKFDESLKEPAGYLGAMTYGVTEMAKETLAENYGGKLFNRIGGKKAQEIFKKSPLGQALMKVPGIKGLNKMSSKGKDLFNKKFGGVPGEKVIGSNTEEIFEEMLTQLTPTYGNTMEENLDQAGELLTLDFYTKVAAQTLLMQKTMALGNAPSRVRSFLNKDERAKQKEMKELYKTLGSRYIKQDEFNRAMMKVGEGNFSIQEYNNEIKQMKEAGLIQEANEIERVKIIKQALAAEKAGQLSRFKKAMTKAKYNKNLSPDTVMTIESLLPEIDAMLDTPYLNRSEVITLNSKRRFTEKSMNDINKRISELSGLDLNKEYDAIKEKIGVDESYLLDDFNKSEKLKNYIVDNFDNLSPELQQYFLLKSQRDSAKDTIKSLDSEIKKKTSYNHQMKLEIEQQYMKYLNDMNKQLFNGKITPSQFKKFIEVKGVKNRAKGIAQKDLDRIHTSVLDVLKDEQSSKIKNKTQKQEPVEEEEKPQAPAPKQRTQNVVNTLTNVASEKAEDTSKEPTIRTDNEGNQIVNDDKLDFLPASDDTVNEIKTWANTFQTEEKRKAEFKDFFDDAVEQVGKKAITRDVLETLGDAYEKAGLGKSNWEKIYNENYIDRKSITRNVIASAVNDNTTESNKGSKESNVSTSKEEVKKQESSSGINPATGDIIRLTPVQGKTNVISAKANFRGLVYQDETVRSGNTVLVSKKDTTVIPTINEDGIVNIKELLHPNKNNPGTIWDTEVLSEEEWNSILVTKNDSDREFVSFKQWIDDNKPSDMSLEEFKQTELFISKVPILYKNGQTIVSVVPDTDWYNPYNIKDPNKESGETQDLDNPTPAHKALIQKGKNNTFDLRKNIVSGNVKTVEVISKSGSPIDFYPVGTQLPYLNQVGTTYPIVFMKGDQLVDLNDNRINDDEIEVINFGKMKKEAMKDPGKTNRTKILVPVNTTEGKKKYIAYNTMALNENSEAQAFSEDAETAKFITAAHLRLAFGDDVTALKNSPFQLSIAEAKSIQSQIKESTGLDIANFNTANELVKALVVFQYKGRKYTMDKTIEDNGKNLKVSALMLKGEGNFIQNTSLSADRKRIPLSIKRNEGGIKVDKLADNYEDYLRTRLSTEIIHYNLGTEENPAWTAHMQPIIQVKPIESDPIKSIEISETGNSAKEEARQILKDDSATTEQKKEAEQVIGSISELSEEEKQIVEDAEQYLRDIGMIDSDENSDDLLPTITNPEVIEEAIKNVANLTLAQQRDITSYILSTVASNYDFSKTLTNKEFNEMVKDTFEADMQEKLDATNSTIENLRKIQETSPSERVSSVISQLEIAADTINEVKSNYNTFFEKAYLEGMRKGFIPSSVKTSDELRLELEDTMEEETYEKNYSQSSNEIIHKDKISKKLKRFFATISTEKKGFLGLPKHENYDVMYNTISTLIVSDLPTNPDFESMMERLNEYKDSFPWLNSFISEIQKADDDVKNAFTYNMYKYAAKAKFVIFTKHNDGINSEVWDSNANSIKRKIKESWNNNFKRSNITNGSTLNTKKLESLWKQYESWGDEPWNTDDKVLRKWLSDFGIKLSDRTWNDLKSGKMIVGRGKNKISLGFDSLFFMTGNNRNNRLFSNLALFAKQHKDKAQGSLDYVKNANLHPYKDMGGIMPSLIAMEAVYNSEMKSMTRRDGGKTVGEIIYPNFFFHNIAKLKRDAQTDEKDYIQTLQKIAFSSNSLTLDLLNTNEDFADIFDYAEVGLQSLDEQFKKSNPFGKIDQLSPIDYMFHQRNQFQYMKTEKLDEQKDGFEMRVATMATLTNSDKGRMMLKKTAVFDLFASTNAFEIQDNGGIKFSKDLKELLYKYLIEPELNRIVTHVESNTKDYDKGAVRFNLIPEINNILNKNNVSAFEFLAESNDMELFKELYFENITSFLEESIKNEAKTNVSETFTFIEKGTDFFNNKEYINDTRRKNTPELKQMIAEFDFIINSMISNMDTLQTISGDPAYFYKGPVSEEVGELKASKELGINLGKRMAMMIAPGNVLANSTNETYLQLFLEDQEEVAQNVEEIIGWHYGKQSLKEEYNNKTYQEHINDLRAKSISNDALKQLRLRFDKVKDFLQIEATDAQEYTTLKEHLRVLHGAGRITNEQRDNIIEKVKNDIPLSKNDIDLVLQPVKPVYTGDIIEQEIKNEKGEVIRPARRRIIYIKSSSFPLIPDLVNGTKLEPLMRKMNEMEEEYNMTARASYQSANKVGALKEAINPFDQASLDNIGLLDPDTAELKYGLTLDRVNFKIQQDVPFKSDYQNEDHVSMGTQIFKLLFGDGMDNLDGFYLNGKEISGSELKEEFFNTFSSMIDIQKESLLRELGLDNNYNTIDPEDSARKLQQLLIAEAEERGFSENDIKALSIEKKTIDGKDVYHFKLPLWFSGNSNKFESMLNAIINNKIFKQKLPGNAFIVGSESGITLREDIENIKNNKILHIGNYRGGELKGNEVLAPSKVKINGKLIDLFEKSKSGRYKYLIENEDSFELDPDAIDPSLFENFVFRTPTSSHGSGSSIKIVGFLPDVMGDLMITPKNFITQMGQDFDIDKLTAYQYYHVVGENGRIEKLNESHKEKALEKIRQAEGVGSEYDAIALEFLSAFGDTEIGKILNESGDTIDEKLDKVASSFDLKIAKNKFVEIHNAVYSNPSSDVQARINKVLSMEVAEKQADGIAQLTESTLDESGFNILSPTYQMEKLISGSMGQSAIGIYAKGMTFNSMAQQSEDTIKLLGKDEDGLPTERKIRIGDIVSDGTLGRQNIISIEGANNVERAFARKIVEAQDERVNTATDNEKAQILGRVNITNLDAVAVDNLLSILGIDLEIKQISKNEYDESNPFHRKAIIDEKEVYLTEYSIPYLLHSQPIIKEYFKRLRNGNAIVSNYNPSLQEDILEDLIGDYKKIENAERNFTGERLAEEIVTNNYVTDFQKEILITYLGLIEDAKKVKSLQDVVDMSNLGKSMWESKNKIQKFKEVVLNEDFQNAISLLGEFSEESGELYLGEGIFFTPTTNQGAMVGTSVSLARNLFFNYFPYYDPYIGGVMDNIVSNAGNTGNEIAFQEFVFQEMKKYITAAKRNQVFLDTPSNERRNLFMDTEENTSLSSYISMLFNEDQKEFKAGIDIVKNNSFLSYMSYEKGEDGKPSLIKFDNTEVANTSEEDFYDDFRELFVKDYPLPNKNGEPYSTQKLAQELVAYSHLSGGIVREAIEFHRFIPIEYYDSVVDSNRNVTVTRLLQNYDTTISNWDDRKRLQNFEKQFFQNNPQYATQFPDEFRKQNVVISGNKMYVNKKMEEYPAYVSVKNKTKSKLKRDKWSLYKNVDGHVYEEVDILGEFGMAEYDYDSSNLTSIITSKPKLETSVAPSVSVTPVTNNFSLSPSDTPEQVLTKISESKFDYNNTLPEIASELLKLFPDQVNNVKIKIVNDKNLPIRGRYGKGIITLNMAFPKSAETFVHEFIHSISSDYLNQFYEVNDDGKFLTDKNGNLILKSDLPSDVANLNIVASEYRKAMEKAFPEEYKAFRKKYQLHRNGTPQVFTNRETSLFYPTVNLKEFLAVSLSNNNEFLEEASKIPYKQSGMNIIEKFAKLLNQILSKISGVKNSLAEKAINQSLATLVSINSKLADKNQIITGQQLMDFDSLIKSDNNEDLLPVTYSLKSIDILSSDKAIQIFNKGKQNNWSLDKILTELQIPKLQKEIILDKSINNREDIITSLLADNSFVVEINTAKKIFNKLPEFEKASQIAYLVDEGLTEKEALAKIKKEEYKPTNYYENLTVPGGTNYTENEIATPDITPSIQGHAQFTTDNGIGWFRSDDRVLLNNSKQEPVLEFNEITGEVEEQGSYLEGEPELSRTRRILELQSDLFQKGRNHRDLVQTITEKEGFGTIPTEQNQFLQLLNKNNNWVTFFVKSIIQDSAKKGYEKVLFPKGDTAAKIEGHQTLEEFKKQKEARIKELERRLENKKEELNSGNVQLDSDKRILQRTIEQIPNEIKTLKQELADVESGQTQLSSIAKFYEETITNILKKNGFNPIEITDEYGNKWSEIKLPEFNNFSDDEIIKNLPNCI